MHIDNCIHEMIPATTADVNIREHILYQWTTGYRITLGPVQILLNFLNGLGTQENLCWVIF